MPTWNAEQYLRFGEERTRPCRDLAARIAQDNPARVMDVGCGPGNSTQVLLERWPTAQIEGLDSSAEMIEAARAALPQVRWTVGDIAAWAAGAEGGETWDVVFSNAALQWVEHHAVVIPRLLARVSRGGTLAIQVPANLDAPAHTLMRELAASPVWRGKFGHAVREWHTHPIGLYYDALAPHADRLDLWETEYHHVMPDAAAIVEWYKGTGLRPFLDALSSDAEREGFAAAYLDRIRAAYPAQADGRVLFPFRRLFVIATC